MNIKFTAEEIKALKCIIDVNPCTAGCVYPEMQDNKKDCDDCPFSKAIYSIEQKIYKKKEE